jgi:hypothetical protein
MRSVFGRRPTAQNTVSKPVSVAPLSRSSAMASSRRAARSARARDDLDAVAAHLLQEPLAQHFVEAVQKMIPPQDQRHFRAERTEHAGKLDRDIARANDRDASRLAVEFEEAVGGDAQFHARYVGQYRSSADGDHDVVGGQPPVADVDRSRRDEATETVYDLDFVFGETVLVGGVEPPDVFVARPFQPRPVEIAELRGEAVAQCVLGRVREIGCGPHDFLRHAAYVYAGAAHAAGFHQRDSRAVARCAVGGGDPAAAAADDQQIERIH